MQLIKTRRYWLGGLVINPSMAFTTLNDVSIDSTNLNPECDWTDPKFFLCWSPRTWNLTGEGFPAAGWGYAHHPNHAFKFSSPLINMCRKTSQSIKVAGFSPTFFTQANNLQYSVFGFTAVKKRNMQFKAIFASVLTFATLAAAANVAPPVSGKTTIAASQCGSGHLRCCKFHFSPKIVIVLWKLTTIFIGKSAVSPSDAASILKPLGYSPSNISGYVGRQCTALSDASKPWFVSNRFMNVLIF